MSRVVITVPAERVGRDISWALHHTLHGFMDFVTAGLWIPIHIRSTRKVAAAFRARGRA